ncbi:MAG TPA: hypothetical protein VGX23_37200 [Actinocrinis sp.]|nr:hypothetical protein [Actinocrinis sp.]
MDAGPEEPGTAGRGRGRQVSRTRVKLPPDPYGDETPRRPIRFRALAVLLSVAVLLTVAAVVNHRHSATPGTTPAAAASTAPAAAAPSAPVSGGPTTVAADTGAAAQTTAGGIPVGYTDTTAGAEAAAANYVAACWSAPMVSSSARNTLINAIADPAIAPQLQGQLTTLFNQLKGAYGLSSTGAAPAGQTFVERTVPVGVSLVSAGSKTTTVAVWVVTMSGLTGANSSQPVTEGWATVTVTLSWTHQDWKWSTFTDVDGPTPLDGETPSTPQAVQNALGQFGGLPYAG